MTWLFLALVACAHDDSPPVPNLPPDITPAPIQAAPLIEPAPVRPASGAPLNVRILWEGGAGPFDLGDAVPVSIKYDLPDGCWRHESAVKTREDDRVLEVAIVLRREGDMCTMAIVPIEETHPLIPSAVGEWTFDVSFDGVSHTSMKATVNPRAEGH